MSTLATRLRNACLGVLLDNRSNDELTDQEYALLGMVETWAMIQDNPFPDNPNRDTITEYARKLAQSNADTAERLTAKLDPVASVPASSASAAATLDTRPPATGYNPDVPAALQPRTRPVPTFQGMPAAEGSTALPGDDEQKAALPLGTADRGPEPQDAGTLLSTEPEPDPPFDPLDPPPDYAALPARGGDPKPLA